MENDELTTVRSLDTIRVALLEIIQPPAPCGNIPPMEDEFEEDFAEILMPRPQTPIGGEELDRRMDKVMANKELLEAASIQIHELLGAMHDLSIKLNDVELEQVQVAACLAQALIHPTLPEDFFPDPDSLIARTESFLTEILGLSPEDSIIEIMERIGRSTYQWEVLDMSVATFNTRRSVFRKSKNPRPEMLMPMTVALCACICEITLWPPNPPE